MYDIINQMVAPPSQKNNTISREFDRIILKVPAKRQAREV